MNNSAEHQGQPHECPICRPVIAEARGAGAASSKVSAWGNFKGYNSPSYRKAKARLLAANKAYVATKAEHWKALRSEGK